MEFVNARAPKSESRQGKGRFALAVVSLLLWLSAAAAAAAQENDSWGGKRVMITRQGVQFRIQNESNGPAPMGMVLEVSKANDPWLWFQGRRGWIHRKDVVLVDEATDHFTAAIERNPTSGAYWQRGVAYVATSDFDKAIEDFTEAIRRDAKNVAAYNDRGNALAKLGKLDEALKDFSTVIDRGVRHPAVYTNRGLAWHAKGDDDRALADYNQAIQINSRFAPAWEAGGIAREAKGDYRRAIENYRRAVELAPNFVRAHNNLAWILATNPDAQLRDGQQAVQHATKACDLTGYEEADHLDTLAAAQAESGQFDEAVKWAKKALEKATADQKTEIEERLKLYEREMPLRGQGTAHDDR